MLLINKRLATRLLLTLFLILSLALLAACTGSPATDADEPTVTEQEEGEQEEDQHEEDQHEEGTQEEGQHGHEEERIPNEGAMIHIVSPEDGATFATDEDVVLEVEVEQFELGVEGSHWHVYVDDTSWGMVTGGDTREVLRGLEPGEHRVEVYLAGGDHIELEDGDSVTITVEE